MAKSLGVWGIDIGQCALKALRLEMIDGKPTATAFDYIEHPKILSQPDADPDALTRESLEKFLSRNPIGKDQVAVGIAGQSGLARFVKLPPVEEKKIAEIVKFEAKQQIPFPLEEVVWDFQKVAGGETIGGFAMETEIGLFAMKRDIINKHLGYYKGAGAEVHIVQMAPLALCNYATYELLKRGGADGLADGAAPPEGEEDDTPRGKKRCAVVLDIGTDSSNLIITDGGKIIWQRPIPLGGNHFTRALTKEMKLTFAKAEHLKRNAAKSADLAQILKALRPVLTEFVGEVQRSLGYFTNTHRDAHVAYMVGLGSAFRLPGLQKYLSEKLSLDVRKPTSIERLAGDQVLNDPTFTENLLTFPVSYGLALQGLGLARLQTNLLPHEVRTERMIRAKKPAVAMAAAALLLGTGFLAVGKGVELSAVSDSSITAAAEKSKKAVDASKAQDKTRSDKKSEIDTTTNEVKAIIVGNDERLNWIRLQEVLVAALPRHGDASVGGNLGDDDQRRFWNFQDERGDSQRAFTKYTQRMAEGIPIERLFDDDMSQYLANINVETIYCRYADNLNNFLSAADRFALREYQLNIADDMPEGEREADAEKNNRNKPKPVEGGGWVFEIRGYTSHKDGPLFLRRCLLKNLQKFDVFAGNDGDKKIGDIIPDVKDPVKGKVSYPFLLLTLEDRAPATGVFKVIGQSKIDSLIGRGASAGGQRGPSGPGGPGGPGGIGMGGGEGAGPAGGGSSTAAGPAWSPLLGVGGSSASNGGGLAGPGMPGDEGPSGPAGPEGDSGGDAPPGGPLGGGPLGGGPLGGGPSGPGLSGGSGAPKTPSGRVRKSRYEFILCFIWKEPTPTDITPTAGTP